MTASRRYEAVIGLEVHAQLLTRTKLFCGCATRFGDPPNTNVCAVCLGLPGALPVPNRRAVELAVLMALATECTVHGESVFARKNYFYPDLPKGYQISQYERPLAEGGRIVLDGGDPPRIVRIRRIHLEEDAGKLLHEGFTGSERRSGVDFNRAGVPLIEIVSEPDLRSPDEAVAYAQSLKAILEYTGVSDADMEKGNLRCDANVSVRPVGARRLGTKVEVKNLNSFRFMARALAYEIDRQIELVERGEEPARETRLFDEATGVTAPMRGKEEEHDYRYFPEPDLPPLLVGEETIETLRAALPELPAARRARFVARYGLGETEAAILTSSRALAEYFEKAQAASGRPRPTSNWILSELLGRLNEAGLSVEASPVPPEALGELVRLVEEGTLSGKMAKEVFDRMIRTGETAGAIVRREGLTQITDPETIAAMAREVIDEHPRQVAELRAGKKKILGWLVGRLLERSGGRANPAAAREALERLLGEPSP